MPYIIAFIIIVVAGVAFTLTKDRSPMETADVSPVTNERDVTEDDNSNDDSDEQVTESTDNSDVAVSSETGLTGTFSGQSSYFTPRRTEHLIDVNLTLDNGIITEAEVLYNGEEPETPNHTSFDEAYASEVIGKPISEVSLSRVGGSSLTSNSFNEAIDQILNEQT